MKQMQICLHANANLFACKCKQIPEDDEINQGREYLLFRHSKVLLAHDFTELIPIFSPGLFNLFN